MTRPVSLAMYEPGGAASAALWDDMRAALAEDGVAGLPAELTVPADHHALWLDAELLLAQSCGYPLRHALRGKVRYVGTPEYEVEGTDGAYYRSALVVRADDPATELADLRGRRAAYNSGHSQSGYNAFRDAVAPLAQHGRFFAGALATGSHAASLRAVIAGTADIAAIDPVSLALEPAAIREAIKVIGWTERAPGLPLISSAATPEADIERLRRAMGDAAEAPSAARRHLRLAGFAVLAEGAYDGILAMEQRALDRSYPLLT